MASTIHAEAHAEVDHCPVERCRIENDELITRDVKSAVNEVISNEMTTLVEESLDDILQIMLHYTQSGILSVVYNVVEQEMLDQLNKKVMDDKLITYITNFSTPT